MPSVGKTITALFMIFCILIGACSKRENQNQQKQGTITGTTSKPVDNSISFQKYAPAIFTIETFENKRVLEKGRAFMVGKNMVVAPFSLFESATRAELTSIDGKTVLNVEDYLAVDRINDLIILKTPETAIQPLNLYLGNQTQNVITYTLGVRDNGTVVKYKGKCLDTMLIEGQELLSINNVVRANMEGDALLVKTGQVFGLAMRKEVVYERQYVAIPAKQIHKLVQNLKPATPIQDLDGGSDELFLKQHQNTTGARIVSDQGVIEMKFYDQIPSYKANFIRLTLEGFYDSLLIHRVIRGFGIQSGAADTRYAKPNDPIGWKGPGYTIPAHIETDLFHKRGAIGSPRKPDTANKKRRSDGSQYYIVTGRTYTDRELDELERENNYTFPEAHRSYYKTIGGAPHLDGAYTVFGEVTSGLNIADAIQNRAVDRKYRPQQDIRVLRVELIQKE